ncbi:MAG: DUF3426 domain-containing protein [Burkholderiaceae bacterium]|nr:DUF3426 domain-containing protein [Burkholderiaceae bacterium]
MTTFITRCPTCSQAFKLDESVLNAKEGQVRCGFCNSVFNAKEHLYRSKTTAPVSVAVMERQAEAERQGIASMKALASQLQGFDAVDDSANLTRVSSTPTTAPARQEVINAPLAQESAASVEPSFNTLPSVPATTEPVNAEEPEEDMDDEEDDEPKRSRTWLWFLIALIAAAGIAAQLLAMYRPMVLEKAPQMEKVYAPLCQYLKCADAEKAQAPKTPIFSVVSQKLEKLDDKRWAVRATVKNATDIAQKYPALLVQLKSAKEDILTRRQVLPENYLEDKAATVAPQAQADIGFAFELQEGEPATLSIEIDSSI